MNSTAPLTLTRPRHTTPEGVTIRPAQWADKSALLAMIGALSRHHGEAATLDLPALVHLLKADMPWLKLIVAEHHGRVIGYAGLTGGMRCNSASASWTCITCLSTRRIAGRASGGR